MQTPPNSKQLKGAEMKSIIHRDQVHGDVYFDPLATALLDTAPLQRLGKIYQLGYAHLVYRGGTHTRLAHVMGAYHVAGQLVELLKRNYGQESIPHGACQPNDFLPRHARLLPDRDLGLSKRWDVLKYLVQWAALLHDLGHIPLGHTLEDEFDGIYLKHDDFASPRMEYLWGASSEVRRIFQCHPLLPSCFVELDITANDAWRTVMCICLHKEGKESNGRKPTFSEQIDKAIKSSGQNVPVLLQQVRLALDDLEESERTPTDTTEKDKNVEKEGAAKVKGKLFFPYMADIVGDTICADYLDYVKRDPQNVGLDVLRDNRVASRFYVGRNKQDQYRMALSLVDSRGKPRLDTCTGVVELVRQRFRFAEIIYYHKTKVAASAMLAKVFALLGKPVEVPGDVEQIRVEFDQAFLATLANQLLAAKGSTLDKLTSQFLPNSLLAPEIGDESLIIWLLHKAAERLRELVRAGKELERKNIERCLRGIGILQALARRELYKICFAADRSLFEKLSPGSHEQDAIEAKIDEVLKKFRSTHELRSELECRMAEAAGWPDDSILIYVPDRKTQAKGIETGALDNGEVITLGKHPAVKDQVDQLNRAYSALWRILVFIHPNFQSDALGLSCAIDVLVEELWKAENNNHGVRQAIKEAAWFSYIPASARDAARVFAEIMKSEGANPDWGAFFAAQITSKNTIDTEEQIDRAVLIALVPDDGDLRKQRQLQIAQRFPGVRDVSTFVSKRKIDFEKTAGREGNVNVRAIVLKDLNANWEKSGQKDLI